MDVKRLKQDFLQNNIAPTKNTNRRKYKEMMKDIDRREFSGQSFLMRLNNAEQAPENYTLLPEFIEDMSLEQHLDILSNKFTKENLNSQNDSRS